MRIFLDTANIEEIRKAAKLGIICGVTTNPSLMAKENSSDLKGVIQEIVSLVDGPISAEVVSPDAQGMIEEAQEIAKWSPNVVVKIPICPEGLEATSNVAPMGVKTNLTLCFSVNQALLAARAGATYVSPFVGRLDDIGQDGMELIRDTAKIFKDYDLPTQIISASIRHPMHCTESAKAGAHIATVPYKVLMQMIAHPLTDKGMAAFDADWKKVSQG